MSHFSFASLQLIAATALLAYERGEPPWVAARVLVRDAMSDPRSVTRLAVPGALYTLQNTLLFVALSYLPAPVYQVQKVICMAAVVFSV